MVNLPTIQKSNSLIPSTLPQNPVAIFVGGTKGIGAHALRAFATHTAALCPRIYVLSRTNTPAVDEAQQLCPKGTVTFISCDASLMRSVDRVCADLLAKEPTINLLFMSQGTLNMYASTSEGMHMAAALTYYSRVRFAQKLLPAIRKAKGLKRVVNVFTGTKEGPVFANDWHLQNQGGMPNPLKARAHAASMLTLGMERLCREEGNGEVGFVHNFPGFIRSDIANSMPGFSGYLMRFMGALIMPFKAMDPTECGERQLFYATSARFDGSERCGVQVDGVEQLKGTDGVLGSGNYTVDEYAERGDVDEVLKTIRDSGDAKKLWEDTKVNTEKALNS